MSFDRLNSLESQPTTFRRSDDPQYHDDPEFQRLTESLSNQLFTLTSNITRLSDQIALLGTKRDTERVRERVHSLLEQTRTGFREVGDGIKKVQTWEDVNPSQKWTQQKLSTEFKATLEEFQTVQRRALEKQRASAVAARTSVDDVGHPGESGAQQQQQQQQLLQEQPRLANQDEVDFQEALIIERETEIRNIEQSVGELNELFRDVAHIVHEQGGQLDIISENVERVHTDTRGANVELRSASRYQKNARNKACCLFLILAVILTIIVLAAVLG
ncbi:t-SNARE [Aspergillus californicus]